MDSALSSLQSSLIKPEDFGQDLSLDDLLPHTADIELEGEVDDGTGSIEDVEGDHCSICLQPYIDRAMIPNCSHDFCFECLLVWTDQSRKCPLCAQGIGDYVIHHIRSQHDFAKHFLPPLRASPEPLSRNLGRTVARRRITRSDRRWGRYQSAAADALEAAIARRRWVYAHNLYVKHVASNRHTRYRPYPTPPQLTASPELLSRATVFLRRELQVWPNLDIEFLVTFVLSLMKSIDIRSESAIKLLAEFLDMDTPYSPGKRYPNAEHFAHEIYSYMRSPYKDLMHYDTTVQYDVPAELAGPSTLQRTQRRVSRERSLSPHNIVAGFPRKRNSLQAQLDQQPASDVRRLRMSSPPSSCSLRSSTPYDKRVGRPLSRLNSRSRSREISASGRSLDERSSMEMPSVIPPDSHRPSSPEVSAIAGTSKYSDGSYYHLQKSPTLASSRANEKGKRPLRGEALPLRSYDEVTNCPDSFVSKGRQTSSLAVFPPALSPAQATPPRTDRAHELADADTHLKPNSNSTQPTNETVIAEVVLQDAEPPPRTLKRVRDPRHRSLAESVRAHLQHTATGSHPPVIKKEAPTLFARLSDVSSALSDGDLDDIPVDTQRDAPLPQHDDGKVADSSSARERLLGRLQDARRALEAEKPVATPAVVSTDPSNLYQIEAQLRARIQSTLNLTATRHAAAVAGVPTRTADAHEEALRAQLRGR